MKKINLILIIVLLFSSVALADFARVDGDIPRRTYVDQYGLFPANSSYTEAKDTTIIGSFNQPLVSDLDGDGISEILVADDDTLYIYTIDDLELDIQASYTLTGSSSSITPAVFDDHDGDGLKEIVGVWDDYFYLFRYNGSKIFNKLSLRDKLDLGRIPSTNMFCDTDNAYSSNLYCFIPTDDGYLQQILITSPFVVVTWDMVDEPQSDDIADNSFRMWGEDGGDAPINSEYIIRGHDSGNIDELRVYIQDIKDNPETANFVYDISICEYDEALLTTGIVGQNCANAEFKLADDVNISGIFGATTGTKIIPLDSYYLEDTINYSIIFRWQSGTTGDGSDDYYRVGVDTAPTKNLIKYRQGGTSTLQSSAMRATLYGSAVAEVWDETDICPSSSSCLTTNPLQPPIMIQDANDGTYKLVLIHDLNNDGNEGLALIDIDTLSLDTQFGTFGYGDAIEGAGTIAGIMPLDLDGGSDEIVFSFRYNKQFWLSAYRLTGVRAISANRMTGTDCGGTGSGSRGTMPFNLGETAVVCTIASCPNSASSYSEIVCVNLETGTELIDHKSPVGSTWDTEYIGTANKPAYTAQMSINDAHYGGSYQIVANRGIFYLNFTSQDIDFYNTIAPMTNGGTPNNIHTIAVADANDDGSLDILGVRSGGISGDEFFVALTAETNTPPVLDTGSAYGGYGSQFGTNNPVVCLDSDIEFFAKESPIYSEGNYINDVSFDNERIVTNCGYDDTGSPTIAYTNYLQEGAYNANNPSIECYYNETGTYRVRLFLQDQANDDDLTQYNTEIINVIVVNGTNNVDCNIVSEYSDTSEISIGANGSGVGTPCSNDNECLTDNCEYGVCTKKAGLQYCTYDYECLSEECLNGKCTKAGVWATIDHSKDVQFGDNTGDNNFISLLLSIGIMLVLIIGSRGNMIGVIAGITLGFGSMAFFTMVGWLSAWIFFAVLIALLLLGFLVAVLFKGHE